MYFEEILITPEMAIDYLELNKVNRKLRMNKVRLYSDDMKNGKWRITHQGIAFNEDGFLIDGQHRLNAIIHSEVSVKMIVARDVKAKNYKSLEIDVGLKRDYSQSYSKDQKVSQPVQFITKLIFGNNVSYSRIDEYYDVFGPYSEILINSCGRWVRTFSTAPIKAGAVLQLVKTDIDKYILDQYKTLVLQDYINMSIKISAFTKLVNAANSAKREISRNEVFVRAYDAFNPKKKDEKLSVIVNLENKIKDIKKEILLFKKMHEINNNLY